MSEKRSPHCQKPGWLTKAVFNPCVANITRAGISIWGSRVLEVRGRQSGTVRRTPVNLLDFGGRQHLVAPRGETQWAAADGGRLVLNLGRRRDERLATEDPTARSPRSSVPTCADGRPKSASSSAVSAMIHPKRTSCASSPTTQCSSSRKRLTDPSQIGAGVAVTNTALVWLFEPFTSEALPCPQPLVVPSGEAVIDAQGLQRLMVADAIGRPLNLTVVRSGALVDVVAVPTELAGSY